MAVPKKKTSVSRQGKRRGGHTHKLGFSYPGTCNDSGEYALPHCISPAGYYKGKKVLETRADQREARAEEEEANQEQE